MIETSFNFNFIGVVDGLEGQPRHQLLYQHEVAMVEISGEEDMRVWLGDQQGRGGGHSTGEGKGRSAALDLCARLLKQTPGRVTEAAVVVISELTLLVALVGGGQVDRRHHGSVLRGLASGSAEQGVATPRTCES